MKRCEEEYMYIWGIYNETTEQSELAISAKAISYQETHRAG